MQNEKTEDARIQERRSFAAWWPLYRGPADLFLRIIRSFLLV